MIGFTEWVDVELGRRAQAIYDENPDNFYTGYVRMFGWVEDDGSLHEVAVDTRYDHPLKEAGLLPNPPDEVIL